MASIRDVATSGKHFRLQRLKNLAERQQAGVNVNSLLHSVLTVPSTRLV